MKKIYLLMLIQFSIYSFVRAQLVCIYCFDQNEPISSGVTNLILNGGFENTNCTPGWLFDNFCPNATAYNCDLEDWICTGGDDQSYPSVFDSTLSIIPEGNNAAYFGNGNAFACSEQWGDSSCYANNFCAITGIPAGYPRSNPGYGDQTGVSLEQTVSGLIVGQTYVLEFWAGGEPLQGLLFGDGIFAVDVGFGKTFLTCHPTGEPDQLIGTRYLIVFDANATSHKIKFTNWGHICDICTELVVDDVSLYTIEELPGSVPDCNTATNESKEEIDIAVYPNPFHESVNIAFDLLQLSDISLAIYNLAGHQIEMLINGPLSEGFHEIRWASGSLPPGVYFYKLKIGNQNAAVGKIICLQ